MANDESVDENLAVLRDDADAGARMMAAFALSGTTLTPLQLESIRECLNDGDVDVRDQVAATLAGAGDVGSLPTLISLMDTTRPSRSRGIAWGIAILMPQLSQKDQSLADESLHRYRSRARGSSRGHADALFRRYRSGE